jgi:hypothetical protein
MVMTDRQTPAHVAQRKQIAVMNLDQCMIEYSQKGLNPQYIAMLEERLDDLQKQFTASRLGNTWQHCDLN